MKSVDFESGAIDATEAVKAGIGEITLIAAFAPVRTAVGAKT